MSSHFAIKGLRTSSARSVFTNYSSKTSRAEGRQPLPHAPASYREMALTPYGFEWTLLCSPAPACPSTPQQAAWLSCLCRACRLLPSRGQQLNPAPKIRVENGPCQSVEGSCQDTAQGPNGSVPGTKCLPAHTKALGSVTRQTDFNERYAQACLGTGTLSQAVLGS